jgi:hypothetical protein
MKEIITRDRKNERDFAHEGPSISEDTGTEFGSQGRVGKHLQQKVCKAYRNLSEGDEE